jgi:hypothetical protein
MKERLPCRPRLRGPKTAQAILVLVAAAGLLAACRPPAPRLKPPETIRSLEGYASLRLEAEAGSAKSRFSFQVRLPSQGRIEVFDLLGRVVFTIVLAGPDARLVIPSQKVYWPASSAEVMDKFLGFVLSLEEWTSLISGVWPVPMAPGQNASGWTLIRDKRNRVISGQRGMTHFDIKEFFAGSPSPRRLTFIGQTSRGSLAVLDLRFNVASREGIFSLDLPESYQPKTWDEIERLLQREN